MKDISDEDYLSARLELEYRAAFRAGFTAGQVGDEETLRRVTARGAEAMRVLEIRINKFKKS